MKKGATGACVNGQQGHPVKTSLSALVSPPLTPDLYLLIRGTGLGLFAGSQLFKM